jgi:hypothetical protein
MKTAPQQQIYTAAQVINNKNKQHVLIKELRDAESVV